MTATGLAQGGMPNDELRPPSDRRRASMAHRIVALPLAAIAAALKASLVLAVAAMVLCIAYQVVLRYVVGRTPSWSEEVAVLMFAWATLGGLALGVREGFHVRLTLLLDPLAPAPRAAAERIIEGLTAALGFYLVWSGWRFVEITQGSVSAAVGYPTEILHGMAPLAGLLMGLFATERMLFGPLAGPAKPEDAP